jgi:hypothetical protein
MDKSYRAAELTGKYSGILEKDLPIECGDGWLDIIDCLCSEITRYCKASRTLAAQAIKYNRALTRAFSNDYAGLRHYYKKIANGFNDWAELQVLDTVQTINEQSFRELPRHPDKVKVLQIKEKFGRLRFYITGGDDYVVGLIQMAEASSGLVCEICSNSAKTKNKGTWLLTRCFDCTNVSY